MSQALRDLKRYALKHGLHLFEGHADCATQMQVDSADLAQHVGNMQAIACYPDHTVFQVCAFVANDELKRFGFESKGEDPGDVVFTSLEDLESFGDPRKWGL